MDRAQLAYQIWLAQLALYRSRLQVHELFFVTEYLEFTREKSREVYRA
ncbi:hypothetical protein [Meiothermus ruber]|jgi:hypothetical protein|uniref:Uncharacterized protein n=1 Tax=Meiothermus ruber (strain ATCC 35948 / DSM 1279 / VKM B-1258 / 21) TaxID=504728 RepID=D3PL69_MEIRD|nr:hypothetical protein [Meiothermus ruber]ADD26965.1 hypothetical protein Mrub_0185 [Meiothermus ruber DSM 1279]AGK03418.1 hypothetical protein K649_00530 [Meiothermus ruber DSM 1279]MCL6530804.1 hypothetical protein [Meiothermus ruber]GAO73881.1 putative uncharacterized protein [Meiothermus ruber H328]